MWGSFRRRGVECGGRLGEDPGVECGCRLGKDPGVEGGDFGEDTGVECVALGKDPGLECRGLGEDPDLEFGVFANLGRNTVLRFKRIYSKYYQN